MKTKNRNRIKFFEPLNLLVSSIWDQSNAENGFKNWGQLHTQINDFCATSDKLS